MRVAHKVIFLGEKAGQSCSPQEAWQGGHRIAQSCATLETLRTKINDSLNFVYIKLLLNKLKMPYLFYRNEKINEKKTFLKRSKPLFGLMDQ